MNAQQFTVDGVTYEVHRKTIRDGLTIDWLNSRFYEAGYSESRSFLTATMFTNFIVSTRVVGGEPPPFMVSPESEIGVLKTALDSWLDAPSGLSAGWQKAANDTELSGNKVELSPIVADPNA